MTLRDFENECAAALCGDEWLRGHCATAFAAGERNAAARAAEALAQVGGVVLIVFIEEVRPGGGGVREITFAVDAVERPEERDARGGVAALDIAEHLAHRLPQTPGIGFVSITQRPDLQSGTFTATAHFRAWLEPHRERGEAEPSTENEQPRKEH